MENPSKSEVIGRCGGDEKPEWPRRTDKSRKPKKIKSEHIGLNYTVNVNKTYQRPPGIIRKKTVREEILHNKPNSKCKPKVDNKLMDFSVPMFRFNIYITVLEKT